MKVSYAPGGAHACILGAELGVAYARDEDAVSNTLCISHARRTTFGFTGFGVTCWQTMKVAGLKNGLEVYETGRSAGVGLKRALMASLPQGYWGSMADVRQCSEAGTTWLFVGVP